MHSTYHLHAPLYLNERQHTLCIIFMVLKNIFYIMHTQPFRVDMKSNAVLKSSVPVNLWAVSAKAFLEKLLNLTMQRDTCTHVHIHTHIRTTQAHMYRSLTLLKRCDVAVPLQAHHTWWASIYMYMWSTNSCLLLMLP